MTPDERFPDDSVLRRVAAARPPIREVDLSPSSDRAIAIADRVLRAHRPTDAAPPRALRRSLHHLHHRRALLGTLGLAAAAACVLLAVTAVLPRSPSPSAINRSQHSAGRPKADLINIHLGTAPGSRSLQLHLRPTPFGAAIQQEYEATQQYVQTGSIAQNRNAIAQLASNLTACEQAATIIQQSPARPGQRAAKRYWIHGVRLQATGDQQLIAALRAADTGHGAVAKRELNLASNTFNDSDLFTAYGENLLKPGSAGPVPPLLRRWNHQRSDP